ncbi:hypothetical protein BGX28_007092 [Mortierella sp. GBA30]|nr:hypothetical protein BGX28_007092 [Mortierella sp. GBA30]
MRVQSIILLSSVALTLLLRAEALPAPANSVSKSPKIDNALSTPVDSTGEKKEDEEEMFPVGHGIVYTKAHFFVNKDNKDNKPRTAMGYLKSLLDIGGINLGGKDKKDKDKNKKMKANDNKNSWRTTWDELTLYGDADYVKRPVPEGCHKLSFNDQMIWDQQGTREQDTGATDEVTSSETSLDSQQAPSATVVTGDTGADADKSSQDATATTTTTTTDAADTDGVSICLFGICIGDPNDDDNDGDNDHKNIHKQSKFLKKFRGKALRIDSDTGCPSPSKS